VFTVIDGLLFRPRVAYDPATFVDLQIDTADASGRKAGLPFVSLDDYEAYARATSLRDVAAWTPAHASLGEAVAGSDYIPLVVTCNFFAAFGPERPILGRRLVPDDCTREAPPVVVIGEDLWRTALSANPDIIGASLTLNRRPFHVVGVMPSGYAGQLRSGIWVPLPSAGAFFGGRDLFRERSTAWLLGVVGRLRAGASRASAASELEVIAHRLDASAPGRSTTVRVTNGAMIDTPGIREAAGWGVPLVLAGPSLVLLIACANVAMLLLSRSAARQHEMAVRVSLGASRARLLRMLVTESALLAALAVPPSLVVAYAGPAVIRSLVPTLPYYPFAVDSTVLAYILGITLFAGGAASVAPAIESLKKDVKAALHGQEAAADSVFRWRPRDVLMAAQVSMSLVLLVGAGVFVHAEWRLLAADPGYEIEHVMQVAPRISIPPHTPESASLFYQGFQQRVLAVPGVRGVGYARGTADDDSARAGVQTIVAVSSGAAATTSVAVVSSQYFRTLKIPLVSGAPFADDGTVTSSVLVSESLGRALWGRRVPVGEAARLGDTVVEIAGVVGDVQSLTAGGERAVYRPAGPPRAGDAMYVGFDGPEIETARAVRDAIAALDTYAVAPARTLASMRRERAAKFFVLVEMVLSLGVIALALGVSGIYGVVSFAVGRRTREMGIRIALGATRGDIMRLVLSSGAVPVFAGVAAGIALALMGSRTLERVFAGTPVRFDGWDPIVYAGVIALLAVTAAAAMVGPARRAASADPVHALRQS
jgi:putative ABC transport system permease protein